MSTRKKLLIVNDNHAELGQNNKLKFVDSTFHRFLTGFDQMDVHLSTPVIGYRHRKCDQYHVDGAVIVPRIAYRSAFNFYKLLPFFAWVYFFHFLKLFQQYDAILIATPASSSPISFLVAKILKKPVFVYIVGDVLEVIETAKTSYRGMRYLVLIAAR